MRFVCESCRAQYMINDEKVGPKGVKVRCRKCGYVIHVKRTDAPVAATKAPAPSTSSDPDDAMATQVMTSPLSPSAAQESADLTNPGLGAEPATSRVNMNDPAVQAAMAEKAAKTAAKNGNGANGHEAPAPSGKPGDSFLGADEDEIGAVFDSVLAGGSTGPTTLPKGLETKAAQDGDRESTKVLDAEMVKRLAEESAPTAQQPKIEEVPQQDWYVALNDKQTGPMPLDQLKQHWDTGEVGPDSLCWRAGFSDWIPVSEVKILASVLAPKPAKPIVVAPAATVNPGIIAPSVVSVPVQSAFSAGGVVTTVQSEVQVPIAASAIPSSNVAVQEDTGTWRPSAASALASLVKEEMDVLAKPPKKAEPVPEASSGGLLDLPVEEKPHAPAHVEAPTRPAPPPPPPVNPYMANPGATFSAPAVTQYRPPSNRGLLIGLGVGGGAILLSLIALIIFLLVREPKVVVAQPPIATNTNTPPIAPPPVNPPPTVVAQNNPPTNNTPPPNPPPTNPTTNTQTPVAVVQPNPPPAEGTPAKSPVKSTPRNPVVAKAEPKEVVRESAKEPVKAAEPVKESSKGDDDFDNLFGDGKPKKAAPKEETKSESASTKKKDVYIPPPPGSAGGDLKDEITQGDVTETVLANKGSLANCAQEHRKREPGVSGKLVMRWTVLTSGKVSNVGLVTEEFKGTYMAQCVAGVIKGMTFPRSKKQSDAFQFPFKF